MLERKQYADFLTSYVTHIEEGFVLNLNASWGMGKTFFINRWIGDIKEKHPTVYFNAWESDFSQDPLLAAMSAIYDQLQQALPDEQKTIQGFSKALKSGAYFFKGLAPVLTQALVAKTLGSNASDELSTLVVESYPDVAERSMSLLLDEHAKKANSILNSEKH